jgi:hypothetical protein
MLEKDYKGLIEAYASIYKQPEQVIEEQVDLEVYSENIEVDPDFLVDLIVEHLITEGYTKTENQALDIIPHISDTWLDNIIESIIIEEHFIDCVNSLVEEGYDLSSYTWDDLYEEYTNHLTNQLNEVAALAPALGTPVGAGAVLGGLALGALGKVKQASDYLRTSKQWGYGDPASKRWLETGSYASKKETPKQQRDTAQQRRQQAAERVRQRQQAQQTTQKPPTQPSSSTTSGGASSTPPSGPTPPKGPNALQRLASDFGKAFKQSASKPPSGPGTPPSGPTKPNPFMTAAGKLGGALYQGARPILKSAARGTGALGAIGAVAGTADELAFRGAGRTALRKTLEFTRQAGPAMRGEKPAPAAPPSSSSAIDKLRKL